MFKRIVVVECVYNHNLTKNITVPATSGTTKLSSIVLSFKSILTTSAIIATALPKTASGIGTNKTAPNEVKK